MRGTSLFICALALAINSIAASSRSASEICAAEGSNGILIAHEDCNKFYKCYRNSPAAIDCPLNLLYNAEKEYCDWPENVDCNAQGDEAPGNDNNDVPAPPAPPVNTDPSEATKICAAEGSDGILIAHAECNKFYKCSEDLPAVLECPLNLLYNAEKEYCDWPENVICNAQGGEESGNVNNNDNVRVHFAPRGNTDPSKAKEICAAEGSDGILVAHAECNKFYKCSEGLPAVLECPLNLMYNAEKEYCDWPENVDCNAQEDEAPGNDNNDIPAPPAPPVNTDPSEATKICAAEGSDGILIAHAKCNKFYKCSEGLPAVLECPLNLLYNAEKEFCDWPENVVCA